MAKLYAGYGKEKLYIYNFANKLLLIVNFVISIEIGKVRMTVQKVNTNKIIRANCIPIHNKCSFCEKK